jgi:hypothetical protein
MPRNPAEPGGQGHCGGTRRRTLPQDEHDLLEYVVDEVCMAEVAKEVATHGRGIARKEHGEGALIL